MKTTRSLGQVSPIILSEYIVKNYGPMSHLKVQKLLYYCEAYHLAYFDQSLINSDFEAWVHGPVCREVFNSLRDKSILYNDLAWDGNKDPDPVVDGLLNSGQLELIKDILASLSKWTGLELEAATHREAPWIQARSGYGPAEKCTRSIDKQLMAQFYRSEMGLENGVQ